MSADSILIRKTTGTPNTQKNSQSRKVSLEPNSFDNQSGSLIHSRPAPLHSMKLSNNSRPMDCAGSIVQRMDRVGSCVGNEIGLQENSYMAFDSLMPMHPAEAGFAMGRDRMMDFPPQGFASFIYSRRDIAPHMNGGDVLLSGSPLYLDDGRVGRSAMSLGQISSDLPLINRSRDITGFEANKIKARREPSSTSFPNKLYKILANPIYHPYIAWLPHGRAWRILKPKEFCEIVLPKHFRSDRYASFMRQVNGWGFKRISDGQDQNAYYHELFLRGFPQVCAKMRRPGKAAKVFETNEMSQTPDFYKISKYAPLPELEPCGKESRGDSRFTSPSKDNTPFERQKRNNVCTDDSNTVKRAKWIGSPLTPSKQEAKLFATPASTPGSEEKFSFRQAQTSPGDTLYPSQNNLLGVDVSPPSGWENNFPIYNSGKVTPPRIAQDNFFGYELSSPLSPSIWSPVSKEQTDLSEADLCYLEHQNRILLGQHSL